MKKPGILLFITIIFILLGRAQRPAGLSGKTIGNGQVPNLTKDQSNHLHLAFGSGDSVMYAHSENGGSSFSSPELVATLSKLFSFAMRGPQISVTGNIISIIASNRLGDIYAFQKVASGKWNKGVRVNDVDTIAKEGLLALSGDGQTHLFAAWLDTRNDRQNNIFGSKSVDGGKSWSKNIMIYRSPDGHVCECCKPSVMVSGKNTYVMFRNWLKGNRDLYLVQSTDAGKSFGKALKLGENSWALNGCPMDGGGLAIDRDGHPVTVWRREGKIFACTPGEQEQEVGEGKSCTLASIERKNVYAWIENGNVVCLLPGNKKIILGKGKLPVLQAVDKKHLICVWQNEKKIMRSLIGL